MFFGLDKSRPPRRNVLLIQIHYCYGRAVAGSGKQLSVAFSVPKYKHVSQRLSDLVLQHVALCLGFNERHPSRTTCAYSCGVVKGFWLNESCNERADSSS